MSSLSPPLSPNGKHPETLALKSALRTFSICRADFGLERPKTPIMIRLVHIRTICIFIREVSILTLCGHTSAAMAAQHSWALPQH